MLIYSTKMHTLFAFYYCLWQKYKKFLDLQAERKKSLGCGKKNAVK
jgi:hypothetical protein